MNSRPSELTAKNDERIEREKIRLAFGNWLTYADGAPIALIVTLLMCGLFPSIGQADPLVGAGFMAAVTLWAGLATCVFVRYGQTEASNSPRFWRRVLSLVWCSHSLIWGSLLFLYWDSENTINQAILCTLMLGVMVSYFFILVMCLEVLVLALASLALMNMSAFIFHDDTLSRVFILLLPIFMIILVTYGIKAARSYTIAMKLRFENEDLAAALVRANQAKSAFLASMSHELRTPLNAIIGYTDLMRQRTFGPVMPHRYAAYLDDIHASGQHLLQMINDLLDIAKIEAGKQELAFEVLRLEEVARNAMRFVEPQADRTSISLSMNFAADAVIMGDERAIKQVLVNLLSNAIKFSRPGSEVVVFCRSSSGGHISLGVQDHGTGMTPEVMERVLLPFEQGSDAYTIEGRGTGLGLSICKQLVEAHGGKLRLESTPGIGSTIWAEFPEPRVILAAGVA
jgi:signal transduction histidine kinase